MIWIARFEKDTDNANLEKKLWDAADTATRVSANTECEATWRDFREAKDHWSANSGLEDMEYFLGEFAMSEGQGGGELSGASSTIGTVARRVSASDSANQFYTPISIVRLLTEVIEPYHGRILETLRLANSRCINRGMNRVKSRCDRGKRWPCASTSGGMFVSSARFVSEHKRQAAAGKLSPSPLGGERAGVRGENYSGDPSKVLSIHGVEKTDETGRLCRLVAVRKDLAVRGLECKIKHGGNINSYYDDPHDATGLFDFVLAIPPFNVNAVDTAMRVSARHQPEGTPQDLPERKDHERLKDMAGPGRRFPFGLPRTDNATATRASAKTKSAKPDRRSVELHYLWIQLFHSALNEKGRVGFVMANTTRNAHSRLVKIIEDACANRQPI